MGDDMTVYGKDYLTRRLLDVVGDQWRPIVIFILGKGLKRYGELQRCLPDVSKKMLTQTLRVLEHDGLVKRTVYAEVPPKVEYELTPLGRSFLEPVTSLCRWATTHTEDLDAVLASRKKSDRRKKSLPGAK
ncbi:helix-turn-helix domain-containing protein (plasmid) [Isosphaeraceae bacterium EP7]